MGAHRIEDDVVLAHGQDAPVVTGAYAADGTEPATAPLLVTLEWPGVGTVVVTTRRLITCRTSTGRGAAGASLALSW